MSKYDENKQLKCSFCGKPQSQVKRLISGSGVYICNECVGLCQDIIADEERAIELANYIVENGATVRAAAKVYSISKSTVHKDMTERLPRISGALAEQVKKVLDYNKAQRHLRGGEATRKKYERNQKK